MNNILKFGPKRLLFQTGEWGALFTCFSIFWENTKPDGHAAACAALCKGRIWVDEHAGAEQVLLQGRLGHKLALKPAPHHLSRQMPFDLIMLEYLLYHMYVSTCLCRCYNWLIPR